MAALENRQDTLLKSAIFGGEWKLYEEVGLDSRRYSVVNVDAMESEDVEVGRRGHVGRGNYACGKANGLEWYEGWRGRLVFGDLDKLDGEALRPRSYSNLQGMSDSKVKRLVVESDVGVGRDVENTVCVPVMTRT